MDPISNADRIALLLREKLKAKAPVARKDRRAPTSPQMSSAERLRALAAVEGLSDHHLGRAFIQDLLVEHFGADLINEAKFQRVIDQVTDAIEADAEGAKLLAKVLGELRGMAR